MFVLIEIEVSSVSIIEVLLPRNNANVPCSKVERCDSCLLVGDVVFSTA